MANQRLAQTLPIYKQTYELLLLIVRARKQFSREYRYDLGSHLFESALRCLELIQKAKYCDSCARLSASIPCGG